MTKCEYYDLLLRTSVEGLFPAVVRCEFDGHPRCLYRTPDGRRCAVGVLIPPENYRPEAEDMRPGNALQFCGVPPPDGLTVSDLRFVQEAHDSIGHWGTWSHAAFKSALDALPCFREFAGQEVS